MMKKITFTIDDFELSKLDSQWKMHPGAHNRTEFVKAAVNSFTGTEVFSLNERMRESSKEAET